MSKKKSAAHRTRDVGRAAEKVATDGKSMERLRDLTKRVLDVTPERLRELEEQRKRE